MCDNIKYIRENIMPIIDDIKADLDSIEYTSEMEENAIIISRLSVEELLRPFTI